MARIFSGLFIVGVLGLMILLWGLAITVWERPEPLWMKLAVTMMMMGGTPVAVWISLVSWREVRT